MRHLLAASSSSGASALAAYFALFALCFLLGSIPWGVIVSRLFFKRDIRESGSGNIGATNALRSLGKGGGAAVFFLDFGKGLLAGFLATLFSRTFPNLLGLQPQLQICLSLAFLGCVWGHVFSPWLAFRGGKGIAVAVGCLFFTFGPMGAFSELGLFIVIVAISRYVSLGSIAAACACPFFSLYYFWGNWPAWLICTIAALTVVWAHRGNIARLFAREERRLGAARGE